MKEMIIGTVLVAAALVGPATADPAKASVVATVTTFRNKTGFLGCRLYRSGNGFPEETAGTLERRVAIRGTSATCTFEDLEPGTYAVSVMHDENGDQQLDKNFFGVPTEGYGVSNNQTHALSAPTWDESKFFVADGKTAALDIQLRY